MAAVRAMRQANPHFQVYAGLYHGEAVLSGPDAPALLTGWLMTRPHITLTLRGPDARTLTGRELFAELEQASLV